MSDIVTPAEPELTSDDIIRAFSRSAAIIRRRVLIGRVARRHSDLRAASKWGGGR